MKDVVVSTALMLLAICGVNWFLTPQPPSAFVPTVHQQLTPPPHWQMPRGTPHGANEFVTQPYINMRAALGVKGLLAYGMGFGALMALSRAAMSARRTTMRAEKRDLAVVDKYDLSKTYLNNLPRTVLDDNTVHKLLSTMPKNEWDNPPEDSYLFMLKMYAETYGEGKATKMGWWDYWYMRVNAAEAEDFPSGPELDERRGLQEEMMREGIHQMWLPGPSQLFPTSTLFKWRGKEYFAGDLVQTPVNAGKLSKDFVGNWAWYRKGLKPWQRGLEVGLAHGYFLIGPFTSLGQLRDTPEAATVGLLAGVVCIGLATAGGLIFGKTIKPTLFDKEGEEAATGFQEFMQWHGWGGIGGAAFAHALISIFGN